MIIYVLIATIKLSPRFGNSLGGTAVVIEPGIVLSQSDIIRCTFDGSGQNGFVLNSSTVVCISPILQNTSGFVMFKLNVLHRVSFETQFLASKKNIFETKKKQSHVNYTRLILSCMPYAL